MTNVQQHNQNHDYPQEVVKAANKILSKYVREYLKPRGYLKISNGKFPRTRVYNRFRRTNHDSEILLNQFYKYARTKEGLFPSNLDEDLLQDCIDQRLIGYTYKALTLVAGDVFEPNHPDIYTCPQSDLDFINTYEKYQPATDCITVSPLWFEFLERMFPQQAQRHTACQWLAHMFQRPSERPSWHIMLSSDAGTGKGFLVGNVLTPLLCDKSHILRSFSQLMGKFSHSLESNMLILLDDTKSKSEHTQTELKSVLSEERQYIERKGEMGEMRRTYARILLASNERRPLNLDEDERRWFVPEPIRHKVDGEETQQFISKLAAWLEQEGSLDALYNWFMTYDLTGFNPKRIHQTETLQTMIGASISVKEAVAIEWATTKQVFTFADLNEEFGESADRAKRYIQEAGWIGGDRKDKAKKCRDGFSRRFFRPDGMTPAEALKVYEGDIVLSEPTQIEIPEPQPNDGVPF